MSVEVEKSELVNELVMTVLVSVSMLVVKFIAVVVVCSVVVVVIVVADGLVVVDTDVCVLGRTTIEVNKSVSSSQSVEKVD